MVLHPSHAQADQATIRQLCSFWKTPLGAIQYPHVLALGADVAEGGRFDSCGWLATQRTNLLLKLDQHQSPSTRQDKPAGKPGNNYECDYPRPYEQNVPSASFNCWVAGNREPLPSKPTMIPIPSHQLSFSELVSAVSTPKEEVQALGADVAEGDGLGLRGELN